MLELIAVAFWLMLPAYLSNPMAVLTGGGTPVDFGRSWRGKRILGDGKTWRGLLGGTACGIVLALVLNLVAPAIGAPTFSAAAVVCLPLGAMLGDMLESVIKRRVGLKRGAPLPVADQLDFLVGAWLLIAVFDWGWFSSSFTPWVAVAALVLTPVLHVGVNYIGYKLGKKDVPW